MDRIKYFSRTINWILIVCCTVAAVQGFIFSFMAESVTELLAQIALFFFGSLFAVLKWRQITIEDSARKSLFIPVDPIKKERPKLRLVK